MYQGREDYMNTVVYLLGNHNGGETELSPGQHKFNFSCVLPFNLPTSFESKYGHIRYQIKVDLARPWKLDLKYSYGFTVIKVYDLNYDSPILKTPLKAETTKSFFLGLSSKSVYFSAEIPTRGFVAGQAVPITVTTNNESNIDVKEIKVSLKKIIHYNSQTPKTKTRERIESTSEIRHSGVERKSKDNIVVHMTLPAVPPTNLTFCSIIQVSYVIQIVAKVGGIHFSPVVRLPVTIGTVPLQLVQPVYPHLSTFNSDEGATSLPLIPSAPTATVTPSSSDLRKSIDFSSECICTNLNQFIAPPSYQEAMGMKSSEADNEEGFTEDKPFSPLYPVMNFGTTATYFNDSYSESAAPPSYESEFTNHQNEKRAF